MTTKHHLDALVSPAEQQAMWDRALAADSLRRAAHTAWIEQSGSADRELRVKTLRARRLGITQADINQLEDQGIREAIRANP